MNRAQRLIIRGPCFMTVKEKRRSKKYFCNEQMIIQQGKIFKSCLMCNEDLTP